MLVNSKLSRSSLSSFAATFVLLFATLILSGLHCGLSISLSLTGTAKSIPPSLREETRDAGAHTGPATTATTTSHSPPIGTAVIDYSTAEEYVLEHYQIPNYFGGDESTLGSTRRENVYDARNGILVDDLEDKKQNDEDDDGRNNESIQVQPARLGDCGFELFQAPTQVTNFRSLHDLETYYGPELEHDVIPHALGVAPDDILEVHLWHPVLRGEELLLEPRNQKQSATGPVAAKAHIDTDVGAYQLEGVCNLVDKNRLDTKCTGSIREELLQACDDHRRVILLNIWRPLVPVTSAPLGILAARYENKKNSNDDDKRPPFFPKAAPNCETSRWYIFSNMQPDECLIFKQYDRRSDKLSDLWHCALTIEDDEDDKNATKGGLPRKSFDIKAMVVLKERVPRHLDRVATSITPELTLEQSGSFCNRQAERLHSSRGNPN